MKFYDNAYFPPYCQFHIPLVLTPKVNQKQQKRVWTKAQVEALYETTRHYSELSGKSIESLTFEDFTLISVYLGRSPVKCMKKIREISVTGSLAAGAWSEAEDQCLVKLVHLQLRKWGMVADKLNEALHHCMKIRSGKQCKERWINHLDPKMKRDKWTPEEDVEALKLYKTVGNKWCEISRILGNRTDSSIKNRVKSLLNKQKQNLNFANTDYVIDKLIHQIQSSLAN